MSEIAGHSLGCVNVPKVIKFMQPKAQTIIWVINDWSVKRNQKIIYFLNRTKPFEVYLVPYVLSGRFWKNSVHLKIILDMVQMIWTFDIFMTKLQNCKNNLVQNSDTRGTMISNSLKMVILRPLEIIIPLVSEF